MKNDFLRMINMDLNKKIKMTNLKSIHARSMALIDDGIDLTNGYLQHKFISISASGNVDSWHGTAVAGMMSIFNECCSELKVYQVDQPTNRRIIDAIYMAIKNGNEVINISLSSIIDIEKISGCRLLDEWNELSEFANSKNILLVTSAGNDGLNLDALRNYMVIPAMIKDVITVGATYHDEIAAYSNHGTFVDIYVPGGGSRAQEMLITTRTANFPNMGNERYTAGLPAYFVRMYGTSLSAGLVAGWLAS